MSVREVTTRSDARPFAPGRNVSQLKPIETYEDECIPLLRAKKASKNVYKMPCTTPFSSRNKRDKEVKTKKRPTETTHGERES